MELKLQALTIGTGWIVGWNTFYDLEPTAENITHFSGSSLLQCNNIRDGYFVDLEWKPEEDVDGEFSLKVMPCTGEVDTEFDWQTVLFQVNSQDKQLIVNILNKLMAHGLEAVKAM